MFSGKRFMKNFIAHIEGQGEGCDYTIGCNIAVRYIDAEDIDDAYNKLIKIIQEYSKDRIKTARLYEIVNNRYVDLDSIGTLFE
jgi:hypothetical protein